MAEGLEADLLIDRRRLKRRLFFWRILAIVAVVGAVAYAARSAGPVSLGGQHITRVTVSGIITEDRKLIEAVNALARDKSVAAVMLAVDSPGGSVAGGESLHDALVRVARRQAPGDGHGRRGSLRRLHDQRARRPPSSPATRRSPGSIGVILETGNGRRLAQHDRRAERPDASPAR